MKNILLIVDVQKGFIVEGANDDVKERIDQLVKTKVFDCVISTVYRNYENSPIINLMGWDKLLTEGEQAVVGEAANCSDHFIYKNTYSAYSEELVELLKSENGGQLPECVYVVGMDTECCVLMTAADLFEAGIRPIVLVQYCGASGGEEAHCAGIRSMESLVGSNNIYSEPVNIREDLTKALERAKSMKHSPVETTQKKAQKLVELLIKKGWHISFAESCTGGKAAASIVNVSGASAVFDASFVTYANDAKVKYLGVSTEAIKQYGVVSEIVALEMAKGTARENNAEIGVGISGIAGPSGGTAEKPVGMVCFGFQINGEAFAVTKQFGNIGRNAVRQKSVDFIYDILIEKLQ